MCMGKNKLHIVAANTILAPELSRLLYSELPILIKNVRSLIRVNGTDQS